MDVLKPLRVFLEYDPPTCFEQIKQILNQSSRNISFTFVSPKRGRWQVPALCAYGDVALFLENGVRVTGDISKLWSLARKELAAVYVLPEERASRHPTLMLFRAKYCDRLTPEYIANASEDELAPAVWTGGPQNVGILEVSHA